jgi:phage shock protein PspC (stress-responsive transcriptional regulator)
MNTGKRLTRSRTDYMLGGVCSGLGHYFSIDATIVRLVFVVLAVSGGSGVLLYLVLWIVMPREDSDQIDGAFTGDEFGRRARQMGDEMRQVASQPNPRTAQFIGIALVVIGLVYLVQNLHIPWLTWFNSQIAWPAVLIVAGALLLARAFKK